MGVLKKIVHDDKVDIKSLNDVIKFSRKILRILFIVMIIAGIYVSTIILKEWGIVKFFVELLSIVAPLFIGIVIAWLFNPLMIKLQKKGVRRGISAALIYFVLIILIVLLIKAIIPLMMSQINDLTGTIPSILNDVIAWINNFFSKFSGNSGLKIDSMKLEIISKIQAYGTGLVSSLPEILVNIVKGFFSGMGTFLVGAIIGFFLLISFDGTDKVISFLPKNIKNNTISLFNNIEKSLRKYVQGTLTLSTLVFLVSSLGFGISGLKSALLFGLFCGITNIIPYVGPYLGAAPALIVGFSQGTPIGIGVLITILIVQTIEGNILNPIVMSKTMKLHPVTIILGLLIFGHFWGVIGMILATPIIATVKVIVKYFNDKYNFLNVKDVENVEED